MYLDTAAYTYQVGSTDPADDPASRTPPHTP